jgi:16S rRNA (cytosine967-C5)-methyltransferase
MNAAISQEVPGLAARRTAADILDGVLRRGHPLDETLDHPRSPLAAIATRDRALTRALAATALRRLGTLREILKAYLERGLPPGAPRVESILLIGAAQILWLDVPDHAAVDLSVRLAQADRNAKHFAKMVNAVLRRVAREKAELLQKFPPGSRDTPGWLMRRWSAAYGEERAGAIAAANAREAALDLTVKRDPEHWARVLEGRVLPTGSVRVIAHGPVSALPGYADGEWWVQDAAAALPARLLGDVRGRRVLDLCAAPGGKTAQLAHAGARVTAIDRSPARVARMRENLARLKLEVETIVADAAEWEGGPFDAVLLDAPCLSTGTIRRHPDIPWLKRESDLAETVALQAKLLARAAALVGPGGTLVYCTCSLEPEEGERATERVLQSAEHLRRRPITAPNVAEQAEFLTPFGDLRTLPCHWPDADSRLAGLDGFYAARLQRG